MPIRFDKEGHPIIKEKLTFGQKAADALTRFVGSWKFIIFVLIFMFFWIYLNVTAMIREWDPYPFILLNFVLSCLAAIQAPIILMSENREAQRERLAAKYDYQVNVRSEEEVKKIRKDIEEIKGMLMRRKKGII